MFSQSLAPGQQSGPICECCEVCSAIYNVTHAAFIGPGARMRALVDRRVGVFCPYCVDMYRKRRRVWSALIDDSKGKPLVKPDPALRHYPWQGGSGSWRFDPLLLIALAVLSAGAFMVVYTFLASYVWVIPYQ